MLMPFWLQVGPILGLKLGPFWVPKSFRSRPRRFPRHGREPESAKIDFCAIWGPTWGHFGGQVGPILASKIAPEPPQTPPKTRSEARIRPDPQNGSKMMAPDRAAHSPCQGCSAEGLERVQNGGCHRRTCRSLALLPLNGLKRPLRLTAWKKRSEKV